MPPDPCDIDSFSGSHATGLGSARISCFLPVFSSSVLEIPTQFPSPPAHAPRASVHPSALGDPFHPGCSTLLCTGAADSWLFALPLCLGLWRADPSLRRKHGRTWLARSCRDLDSIKHGILTSCFLVRFYLFCSLDGWFSGQWEGQRPALN